uniref:NADH-ubiquinone oxidoreductase chain 4L n=1 Tax=Melaenis sp. YZ-2018 TaxID=2153335 RepID=A0A343W699_9ANNE|nr:NADH dehydrogenase subunit 4L [Melaenis sp. YZ-2018]
MSFIPISFMVFCTLSVILTMVIQRFHILMTLLALEAMILNLMILALLSTTLPSDKSLFLVMILLTFGACEAALGLACLVKMTRTFGNDHIASSSLSSC